MSLIMKRIIMLFLGLLGACMVWPCLLTIQYYQPAFPGYRSFSLAQGIALGLFFGAIFGSFEGIVVSSRIKAVKGLLFGSVAGIFSGAIGVFGGQAVLFAIADYMRQTEQGLAGIPLIAAHSTGWVIIGLCIPMIEGFRAKSVRKLLVGLAGGIVGGSLGGMLLQISVMKYPGSRIALLAGLIVFGILLSFFYSFFENRFSFGSIKLLNGPLRNKEYHLLKSRLKIGSRDTCDIVLAEYRHVAPLHASILVKKGRIILQPAGKSCPVTVNDSPVTEAALRREDVFAIGSAKFMYGIFS